VPGRAGDANASSASGSSPGNAGALGEPQGPDALRGLEHVGAVEVAAAATGDPPRFALGKQTLCNVVSSLAGMRGQRHQAARHR
jgi:hypothetical protein